MPNKVPRYNVALLLVRGKTFALPATANGEQQLKGSVKELNMFHNYETEKITRKAMTRQNIELFVSSARDHHAGRI